MTTDEKLDAIAAQNTQILRGLALLVRHLGASPQSHAAPSAPRAVTDADLDGQYGDPEVKKNPPRWKGESFVGETLSRCSPDFLDCFADFKEYCSVNDRAAADSLDGDEKAKKLKYAGYAEKDAALARGWAIRLRRDPAAGL